MADDSAPRPHSLPSKPTALSHFVAFYDKATLNKDGTTSVVLKVPPEDKDAVVLLSKNDGMALNVSVWETALPDGMAELARAVGLTIEEG